MQSVESFFQDVFAGAGITDALDILITAFIFYKVLEYIKDTRAQQLLKGLLVLVLLYFASDVFNLHMLNWIMRSTVTVGLFALVVIFQPELRRALEMIGRSSIANRYFDLDLEEHIIQEIGEAVEDMRKEETGALIVFERDVTLEEIAETGTIINADITAELLCNLFYEGSPLHDGAVLIRNQKLYAAGCVLPLTQNQNLHKRLGTRHRAGVGITENSDAVAVIVSEETGVISFAEDGELSRNQSRTDVEQRLRELFETELGEEAGFFGKLFRFSGKGGSDV